MFWQPKVGMGSNSSRQSWQWLLTWQSFFFFLKKQQSVEFRSWEGGCVRNNPLFILFSITITYLSLLEIHSLPMHNITLRVVGLSYAVILPLCLCPLTFLQMLFSKAFLLCAQFIVIKPGIAIIHFHLSFEGYFHAKGREAALLHFNPTNWSPV